MNLVIPRNRTRLWSCTLFTLLGASAVGCGFVRPLGDDGSTSSSSSATTSADTGVSCGTDPQSGVSLCLGTTECPDAKLPLDDFPDCGFRSTKGTYDIECVCNGNQLCPVGTAKSCGDLAGLFGKKSLADVCNQDGCTEVGTAQPASTATAAPTAAPTTRSPTCDPDCMSDCGGSPPCLQACGC